MLGNIQVLRFVAATLVVLFHVALIAGNEGRPAPLLAHFGKWGESGVDIFFVISGLVMVLSQARNRRGVGRFLLERAIRIVPLYWFLTLLLAGLLLFVPQLFNSDSFSASKTLLSMAFVNGLMGEGYPVIYLGWTLEYEWLFYLAFSLSFAAVPLGYAWIPVALFFLALNSLGLIGFFAIEFVYGMAIALFFLRRGRLPMPGLFVVVGIAGLLVGASLPAGQLPRHVGYGIPAALIVAGLVFMPQARGRAVLFMGAASYSIYLVQVFSIPAAFRIITKIPALPNDLAALLVAAASLAAGALVHVTIERPVGRALHVLLGRDRRVTIGAKPQPGSARGAGNET